MGICSSCQPKTSLALNTAKLILEHGRLQEFSSPVRVSHILRRNPNFFICNANDLAFNDHVLAINEDEELELGHLYFELPLNWLDSPITAQEIAALAVKASLAIKIDDDDRDGRYRCCWIGFKKDTECSPLVTSVGSSRGCGGGIVGGRRRSGGGEDGKYSNKLSVILEE
ncbi:uncharacterized protein LOC126681981 [Mercurialis annua]|uniref:uncharacterized protein LOC126681981 n=1 Tax=Mercurialis annua TaxID=3986 RepID=UPI0021602421|nr:uncharacterized protein LOC126681981 [Mercurialis annua]